MLNVKKELYRLRISLEELRETRRWLKLIQRVPLNVRHWIFVFHSMLDVRCSMFDVHLFSSLSNAKITSAPVSLPPLPYYLQYKLCAGHHVIKTDTL